MLDLSVVLPCLNEEVALASCIEEIRKTCEVHGISYEIIVADNGSTDRSRGIAEEHGARVVLEEERGYGAAYETGIAHARGAWLVLGDADGTYDFCDIPRFLAAGRVGADLVIGNRFSKTLAPGAMSLLHRYLGNPCLSFLLRWWFRVPVHDTQCGFRLMRREAYERLNLMTRGMEYASEMLVRAAQEGMRIAELPIHYRLRKGASKLRSFRDGLRHIKFFFLFSPTLIFLFPGAALTLLGALLLIPLSFGPLTIGTFTFYLHPMFGASLLVVFGYELVTLGLVTKILSYRSRLEQRGRFAQWLSTQGVRRLFVPVACVFFALGLVIGLSVFLSWRASGFGALFEIRRLILASTLLTLGLETLVAIFLTSVLFIPLRHARTQRLHHRLEL